MNINIIRTREDEISCIKMKRLLTYKKANKNIFLFFIIALVLCTYNNSDSFKNNAFSANTLLGMIFFGFTLVLYYQNYIVKSRAFLNAINAVKHYKDNTNNLKIGLNDDSFNIETLRNYHRYYWKAINSFRVYRGYIIFLNDSEYYTAFVIKVSELTKEQFEELYSFLKSQRLKEIK